MRTIKTTFLMTCLSLCSFHAVSNCVYGGSFTYTYIGGNAYEVEYTMYRDCSGIQAYSVIPVYYVCEEDTSLNFLATLQPIPGTGVQISPNCAAIPSRCQGGGNLGIEEHHYKGTVFLPNCNKWTMSTWNNCRAQATTIGNHWLFNVKSDFYQEIDSNNTSPIFTNKPLLVIPVNETVYYNPGVYDADGDSLVYSLYHPFSYPDTLGVPYIGCYAYNRFLDSNNVESIDPVTGDMVLFAPNVLSTVMGIKVEEWRKVNGIMRTIGETYYDIHLTTEYNTGNSLPQLSGINLDLTAGYSQFDTVYYTVVKPDDTLSFRINGYDADTTNNTITGSREKFSIDWNQGILGASFQTYYNGTDSAYAIFTFVPDSTDLYKTRHFFAKIEDEACPFYGVQYFKYSIDIDTFSVLKIPDVELSSSLHVYPVPFKEGVWIQQDKDYYNILSLYSIEGRLLRYIHVNSRNEYVELSDLPSGIYIVRINENSNVFRKIVKL